MYRVEPWMIVTNTHDSIEISPSWETEHQVFEQSSIYLVFLVYTIVDERANYNQCN